MCAARLLRLSRLSMNTSLTSSVYQGRGLRLRGTRARHAAVNARMVMKTSPASVCPTPYLKRGLQICLKIWVLSSRIRGPAALKMRVPTSLHSLMLISITSSQLSRTVRGRTEVILPAQLRCKAQSMQIAVTAEKTARCTVTVRTSRSAVGAKATAAVMILLMYVAAAATVVIPAQPGAMQTISSLQNLWSLSPGSLISLIPMLSSVQADIFRGRAMCMCQWDRSRNMACARVMRCADSSGPSARAKSRTSARSLYRCRSLIPSTA